MSDSQSSPYFYGVATPVHQHLMGTQRVTETTANTIEGLLTMVSELVALEPFPIEEGSSLWKEDQLTDPFHISHVIWGMISSALDHLHLIKSAISDARKEHVFANYTLIRSAIEQASTALLLLKTPSRVGRISSLVTIENQNAYDRKSAFECMKKDTSQIQELHEDRMTRLRSRNPWITEKINRSRKGIESIVEDGGRLSIPEGLVQFCWKLCSGIAHNRRWAVRELTELEPLEKWNKSNGGISRYRVTAMSSAILQMYQVAFIVVRDAMIEYDRRSLHYRIEVPPLPPFKERFGIAIGLEHTVIQCSGC